MKQKLLLIYTGGTIGMLTDPKTGALQTFSLANILDQIPQLSDVSAKIDTYSVANPKDSAEMQILDWQYLGDIIHKKYDEYDGFVVLHGTDTMAFTASALSFMFSNLTKPIIFTGSQLPINDLRTDAIENVITAIQIALLVEGGLPVITEVGVYFDNSLFRGNRVTKMSTDTFKAFSSPNYPVLVTSGISLKVNTLALQACDHSKLTDYHKNLEAEVFLLKLHPGITEKMFDQLCSNVDFKVLVLETYGSGNAITANWFVKRLEILIKNEINIINCTQCINGSVVQGMYDTSEALKDLGVISSRDMTTESVLAKAMFLLGQKQFKNNFKKGFEKTICGEIS